MRISIVNVGRLSIYIRQVEVKDKKGISLGSMNTFDMDKNFLIISPNEVITQEISVENKDWMRIYHVAAYLCGDRHRRELTSIEIDRKKIFGFHVL